MSKDRFFHLSGISLTRREWLKKLLPHVVAILVFLLVAYVYCKPAFDGKVLYQEDVLQWRGMAQNSFQFSAVHGHFPIWTNGMFSGMPAYQIAMDGDTINVPSYFYNLFTLWLIKPACFFFLAALCFYFLAGVLRINPYIGIIGGLAFAYSTYSPVIISVGHETKMQTIALLPALLGSMILIFEKRYWQGMALAALVGSMLVSFGHMQIVYYGLIAVGCMFVTYAIRWVRAKDWKQVRRATLITVGAALIGILSNAVLLFTTYDSSKETVRGGSELADNQSNYTSSGLSESIAFDFSMYKSEPMVMMVPYIFGGTTDLVLPSERSKAVRVLEKMPPELSSMIGDDGPRYYWGGVGDLVAGPPYAGAVICLLALIGFFVLDNKHKWWILAACVLTVAMSWGSYFQSFNSLLLKYLPGYNKFRAPSMIIVIPTLLLCVMAMLTLQKILVRMEDRAGLWAAYRKGLLLTLGIFGLLGFFYFHFDYSSVRDAALLQQAAAKGQGALQQMQAYVEGLVSDRQSLFRNSVYRSLGLILAAAVVMGWYIKMKLPPAILLGCIAVLTLGDLLTEDWKYLNYENYNEKLEYQQNFVATAADKEILQDKSDYRVLDVRDSVGNALTYGAMTAYFHRSIGGYHAAKLRIYEDLIEHQLFNYPHCQPVLDMLNTKYIILKKKPVGADSVAMAGGDPAGSGATIADAKAVGKAGKDDDDEPIVENDGRVSLGMDSVVVNKGALGSAWFVKGVRYGKDARAVMNGLTKLDVRDTAMLFAADQGKVVYDARPDTTATLKLLKNDNDLVTYVSQSGTPRFAVFSEVYYDRGWRACIDDFDHEVPIVRSNYVLRGVSVPAGRHIIRFVFRPKAYYLGRQIQWMASIVLILLLIGAGMVSLHAKGLHITIAGRHVLNFPLENLSST